MKMTAMYFRILLLLAHQPVSGFVVGGSHTKWMRTEAREDLMYIGSPLQGDSEGLPTTTASSSALQAIPDAASISAIGDFVSSSSLTVAATSAVSGGQVVSPEPIHTAFSVATFLPQPFWLLMIAVPNASITRKIMGGLEIPLLCSTVHLFIVVASIVTGGSEATAPLAEFNNVFDPAGDPQAAFFGMTSHYPNFVAEEWSHVLTWDLFVGRWIWYQGLRNGVFTAPSVLLCNLIGPPGLLLYSMQCLVTGQAMAPSEAEVE